MFLTFVPQGLAGGLQTAPKGLVKKTAPSKFLRITKDEEGQLSALETAVVRYKSAGGDGDVTVDLIGVVHIGDAPYYRKLNKLFTQYDALLYELVAPPGTVIPKGGKRDSTNPLAMIQKIATFVLDLELQTEIIDYTKKNFVHADMSPAEMAEAIRKRGDDGLTLALSLIADLLRQQNLMAMQPKKAGKEESLSDLLNLIVDPAGPSKIKRIMARQLHSLESGPGLGQTLTTILVSDRNQAALKVLQKELVEKGNKKIGIFYGAAHMPDFEKRLRDDFRLVPVSTQWLPAWDLRIRERGVEDFLWRLLNSR